MFASSWYNFFTYTYKSVYYKSCAVLQAVRCTTDCDFYTGEPGAEQVLWPLQQKLGQLWSIL